MAHYITIGDAVRKGVALGEEQCKYIATAINELGSGGHPVARVNNLDMFTVRYVVACLTKATRANIEQVHKDASQRIITLLMDYCN